MSEQASSGSFKQTGFDDQVSSIVKAWHGRPSALCFVPKALYYLVIIIAIFFVNNKYIYPASEHYYTAFEYQQYMLFNIIDVFHNADVMGWRDWYLLGALAVTFLVCFKIIIGFLNVLLTRYSVSNDQLYIRNFESYGFMEQRAELYRIVDFARHTPALGLIFGYSNINLKSTDRSCPELRLRGIRKADFLLDLLRNETERCRQLKGIREFTSAF